MAGSNAVTRFATVMNEGLGEGSGSSSSHFPSSRSGRKEKVLMNGELKSLKEILDFRDQTVIKNFRKSHPLPEAECEMIFAETLKWLWLCRKHDLIIRVNFPENSTVRLSIFPAMRMVDEMWHAFILCTREYEAFCKRFLGTFIHHAPDVARIATSETKPDLDALEHTVRFVCEQLGEKTAQLWFKDLPARLTREGGKPGAL